MEKVLRFEGVYFRQAARRRHEGRPDRCYYIYYRGGGSARWERIGWASEGYTAQMAAQVRAERIRALRHGDALPARKDPTIGEVWTRYSDWMRTAKRYSDRDRARYETYIKPLFGRTHLSRIGPLEIERMKSGLLEAGKAPATVRHVLALLRHIINKAVEWDLWAGANPVRRVSMPKVSNRRERFLTPAEARLLLEALGESSAKVRDMAFLSLRTGLRAGEIFSLRWSDVDLEHGLLHVADPKSGRPRKVALAEDVRSLFRAYAPGDPGELVFQARGGGRIERISAVYYRTVDRLGLNAGVTDRRQRVNFHTLRHTFASWLALEGVPIRTIQELLGHRTLAMTERYAHLTPDHQRSAVERIAHLLLT